MMFCGNWVDKSMGSLFEFADDSQSNKLQGCSENCRRKKAIEHDAWKFQETLTPSFLNNAIMARNLGKYNQFCPFKTLFFLGMI